MFGQLERVINRMDKESLLVGIYLMEIDKELNGFRNIPMNLDEIIMRKFIDSLSLVKTTLDYQNIILNYYRNMSPAIVKDYLDEIDKAKNRLFIRGRDTSKYKSDIRLLHFALNYYDEIFKPEDYIISRINDKYNRFIFIIYCHPELSQEENVVDKIEDDYSQLLNKNLIHFRNYDSNDFYMWVKDYLDQKRIQGRNSYLPTAPSDYKLCINVFFDQIYYREPLLYSDLKGKISKTWYQREYREKNKGRKEHYYMLTKDAKEKLSIIATKKKIKEDEVINYLINKYTVEHLKDNNGDMQY